MATYSEIVLDLMSIKRGQLSDDDIGDKRQYEFWLDNTRALLIRQDNNKGRSLSENIIQDLGCMELEAADVAECCIIEYGCDIKRTKLVLPKPIELAQYDAILRVATIDKTSRPFTFVSNEQFIWSGNGRFNKNNIFVTYRNSRLYFKSQNSLTLKAMKYANARGIFETPRDVARFTKCSGQSCFDNDSEYPMSNWMIEAVKKMILDTDIKAMLTIPADNNNDASGDPQIQPQR